MTHLHKPVLLEQAIELLKIKKDEWYLDLTFGRGGHTRAIMSKGGKVVAFDHDAEAIEFGKTEFLTEIETGQLLLVRENFDKVSVTLKALNIEQKFAGILTDFGTSVDQLKSEHRGFSFDQDAELDMRMDDRLGVKAKDLLNILPAKQLEQLLEEYGGEESAHKLAKAIVYAREKKPYETGQDLVSVILKIKTSRKTHIHPATKVFQALRIAVNSELDSMELMFPQLPSLLAPKGRVVTICFHDGEDRIAKSGMKAWVEQGLGEMISKKPLTPTIDELHKNPRSRSAKLRAYESII